MKKAMMRDYGSVKNAPLDAMTKEVYKTVGIVNETRDQPRSSKSAIYLPESKYEFIFGRTDCE